MCVHAKKVFSSDLSPPQGPAALIYGAITQISHPRQITDLAVTYGPPQTHTHSSTHHICMLWWLVDTDMLLIRALRLVVRVYP